ncbi:MAG: sulfur carrier protein ThiS [Alphaproteobacteria bacterium]|uniref:Sulfur carrier protein ThiS n=1 Tax=Candidatus Nitrobium versatile TaxID=2884831 RepID=A0A953J3J3_9BACT|nr:sulfur carrier protein ThiS [Candidatus Nitrobium versatile]
MRITLNGEPYEAKGTNVAQLLDELKIAPGRVAVEVNLSIIKKTEYESCLLREGDTVEVVNFVGGG